MIDVDRPDSLAAYDPRGEMLVNVVTNDGKNSKTSRSI